MIEGILLDPEITLREATALEDSLAEVENISVLVDQTAGIASYPSVVSSYKTLRETLRTASHEWLHHYLFFRPLGQAYWNDSFTTSLNETVANMFGTEIGDAVYYQVEEAKNETNSQELSTIAHEQSLFEYRIEMRQTRMRVEEFLESGKVLEAEEYMDDRRQFFADNGYFIRKLNQAYFAFHGNYGDSAASISPLHSQLMKNQREYINGGIYQHCLWDFLRKSIYGPTRGYVQRLNVDLSVRTYGLIGGSLNQ